MEGRREGERKEGRRRGREEEKNEEEKRKTERKQWKERSWRAGRERQKASVSLESWQPKQIPAFTCSPPVAIFLSHLSEDKIGPSCGTGPWATGQWSDQDFRAVTSNPSST